MRPEKEKGRRGRSLYSERGKEEENGGKSMDCHAHAKKSKRREREREREERTELKNKEIRRKGLSLLPLERILNGKGLLLFKNDGEVVKNLISLWGIYHKK
jgi:hypothetical protein